MTEYERGQWEMFEDITSAIYGKQMYFLQTVRPEGEWTVDDKIAWSRESHKYMTRDDAYAEFFRWIEKGWADI